MTALTAIVPTRGRPQAAADLITAFRRTCEADTRLVFAVDGDDPQLDAYLDLLEDPTPGQVSVYVGPPQSTMVRALNAAALHHAPGTFALAFMGDDHRPRTYGWDSFYIHALHQMGGTGMVYGNDLLQGGNLPTQIAMTADIVLALGHMAPPTLTHLFVDNYWKALGESAHRLAYLPDVVIEHLHPFAGKAQMDEGYHRVNAPTMYQRDSIEYAEYAKQQLPADIAKIKALRS